MASATLSNANGQRKSHKVLLMGKEGVGKTSMKSIIFGNVLPKDTRRLGPTIDIARSVRQFLGDLQLSIWDCAGQDQFLQKFFVAQRGMVFRDVAVLIYVFDVQSLQKKKNGTIPADYYQFNTALGALHQHSHNAKIFCLIHKLDTIMQLDRRHNIFTFHALNLQKEAKTFNLNITCFGTSIWDDTLFRAWSEIVRSLLHDQGALQEELRNLCTKSQAEEMVLFERSTMLFISNVTSETKVLNDQFRHERISNIVKQFKLRCNKSRYLFKEMTVENAKFTAYIGPFTATTVILAVIPNPKIQIGAVTMNLERSRNLFEQLLALHVGGKSIAAI